MRPTLKLFTGEELSSNAVAVEEPQVTVTVGEISRILADAHRSNRAWLRDFADDHVTISADLYDVLCTYWNLRPSA